MTQTNILAMASKKNIDPGYTTDLHIRMKPDERDLLQKKADEFGTTLSQAARRIIFKRIEDGGGGAANIGEKEIQFRTLQNLQSVKTLFKKVSTDVAKFIVVYERSLSLTNSDGQPAVNTEQTIRTASSIVAGQIKLQDGLNEIIRHFGGAEVHVAAKPQKGTAVGDAMSDDAGTGTTPAKDKTPGAGALPPSRKKTEKQNNPIPINFRTMLNVTFNGTIISDVEMFNEGNYEKIRIRVEVEEYRNRQTTKRVFDAVDFASRYRNVVPHLTNGRAVLINGELTLSTYSYNGKASDADATIDVNTLKLLP